MKPLIEIDGLVKRYEDFAIDNINLMVEPGMVVGIVGPNGAGKTTILKSILGLIVPNAGTVSLFGGEDLDDAKQRIGVVFDICAFLGSLRICDVGGIGRASYTSWDEKIFDKLCALFNLTAKKRVKELSRGMGMKLSLAFALAHNPELLILDEVTAGLDPVARDEVLDILRSFMREESHGILMTTHITTDLEKIGDEIICIDEGRVVFDEVKETISDMAGIIHCRAVDLEMINASGFSDLAACKILRRGLATDMLVPDRLRFMQSFPSMDVERVSVEDYMTMVLKGESL